MSASLTDLYQKYFADTGSEVAAAILAIGAAGGGAQASGRTVLSPPQVAKHLGVDPPTVIGWIRSGQLKGSNVGSGRRRPRYRIQQSDLEVFLKKRQPDKPVARGKRNKPNDEVIPFF